MLPSTTQGKGWLAQLVPGQFLPVGVGGPEKKHSAYMAVGQYSMLVERSAPALLELRMTSALAGPYAVVQHSVGTGGTLLQSVVQEGEVWQGVPDAGWAAAAPVAAGGDEGFPPPPSAAASGPVATASPRMATRQCKQSDRIVFLLLLVKSAACCASPPRPPWQGKSITRESSQLRE